MPIVDLSLVGPVEPQMVQVEISGLTVGQTVTVTGATGGFSWTVRGGHAATATSALLRLTDAATPINTTITYTVTIDGVSFPAGSITVPCPTVPDASDDAVLCSLDGRTVVRMILGPGFPRDPGLRQVVSQVPGRRSVAARWDVAASSARSWSMFTRGGETVALETLTDAGAPVVLRTNGAVADEPAVVFAAVTAVSSEWLGEGWRSWSISYLVIDDPEPDMVVPVSTGDDFDAAWAGLTWDDFDAEMSGLTGDEFDGIDWTQYA